MSPSQHGASSPIVAFEGFHFHRDTGELIQDGRSVALAPTPARLLDALIEGAPSVVTRAQLQEQLWPGEWFELDQRLNFAIHGLRQSLGDDASAPRIVQTVPRHGYRLLPSPTFEPRPWSELVAAPMPDMAGAPEQAPPVRLSRLTGLRKGWRAAVLAGLVVGALWWTPRFLSIRDDETRAAAHLGMAATYQERGDWPRAATEYRRALALDPDLATPHQALGARALFVDWDWQAAGEHLKRAAALDPDHAATHRLLAHLAIVRGHPAEALAHVRRAREADPGHAVGQGDLGWVYYWAGAYRDAYAACRETVALAGASPNVDACLIGAAWMGEDREAAAQVMRRQLVAAGRSLVAAATPDQVLASYTDWRLAELPQTGASSYARARLAAMTGRPDQALQHLVSAARHRHVGILYASADPLFEPLAEHPTFRRVNDWVAAPAESRSAFALP